MSNGEYKVRVLNLRGSLGLFFRDRVALVAAIVIVAFAVLGIFARFLAPYPAQGAGAPHLATVLQPPSLKHLFGTDQYGRDILSRVLFGIRTSLFEGVAVVGIGLVIGVPLGIIAGYYGGAIDETIMRITDIFLAFPYLLLALIIVATLGPGLLNVIIALSVTWWPWYVRIARGQTVSLKNRPFVLVARSFGIKSTRILLRHIFPNSMSPVIIQATLDFGGVILSAAGLSFLGLGVQEPLADLGLMIGEGQSYMLYYWWVATFPGIALFIIAIAFNLLGDSLRDYLDPRYQKRRLLIPYIRGGNLDEA
ncbi:MAG: ABC transporter permease [Candidatus Acidifodinimicrobium sp.]